MGDNIFEMLALVFTFILLCFIIVGQSYEIKDLQNQLNNCNTIVTQTMGA